MLIHHESSLQTTPLLSKEDCENYIINCGVEVTALAKSRNSIENQPIYMLSQEYISNSTSDCAKEVVPNPIIIHAKADQECTQEFSAHLPLDQDSFSILDPKFQECIVLNNPGDGQVVFPLNLPVINTESETFCEGSIIVQNDSTIPIQNNNSIILTSTGNEIHKVIDQSNISLSQADLECTLQFDQSRCSHIFSGLSSNISNIVIELVEGHMVEVFEKKTVYKNSENNNETISTDNNTKSNLSVMNVTIDQYYLPVPSSSENTIIEPGQINNKEGRPRRGRKRKYPQQNRKEKRAKLNHDIALAKHRQQKPLLDKRGCTGHNKITEAKSQEKKNLTGPELEKVENEHRFHLDKAKSLRQQMKKDMKVATIDNTIETLTFDLE
ncbi:unnamed protein product [Diatraea saccharalis]|uniref:Uncharacterized protein n=1 Tax=Diatraea saccharalis TaxID=40085 RepID=A0A9N9R8B6_9NEOP|nr:unnamed protein product [Diatraea saccharalis]